MIKRFLGLMAISSALICSLFAGGTPERGKALRELDLIQSIFETGYAPYQWKKQRFEWDLHQEICAAKKAIRQADKLTVKECQRIIKHFFLSPKDYHVAVLFHSTELAWLPFGVKGVDGHYYITWINTSLFPHGCEFNVGDEVVEFCGRPIGEMVERVREEAVGYNVEVSDLAFAEQLLTLRVCAYGMQVPSGRIVVNVLRRGSSQPKPWYLEWNYRKEHIHDLPDLLNAPISALQLTESEASYPYDLFVEPEALSKHPLSRREMVGGWWLGMAHLPPEVTGHNLAAMGARQSYLPRLGTPIWQSHHSEPFDAYLFQTASGHTIGYVRIPSFGGEEREAEHFAQLISFFQLKADALVIDQLNNPGGYVQHGYALLSMLTHKPLAVCNHRELISQAHVAYAVRMLPHLERISTDQEAKQIMGDSVCGLPVTLELVKAAKTYHRHVVDQWNAGKVFTDAMPCVGISQVTPHAAVRYTKPILVLINELCMSMGDFFPQILQDNGRATLLGTPTMGAGGCVIRVQVPNHLGIQFFALTTSIAERANGETIENNGVKPDIEYRLTADDLRNNFQGYVSTILGTLESMLSKKK